MTTNYQNQWTLWVSGEDSLKNKYLILYTLYESNHYYWHLFPLMLENDDGIEWYFRCCVTTDPVIIWAAAIWDMNNWSWKWWPVFVNNAGYWGNIAGAGPSFDCLGAATCSMGGAGGTQLKNPIQFSGTGFFSLSSCTSNLSPESKSPSTSANPNIMSPL